MKLNVVLINSVKEYIARCPDLDINCFGSTRDEAIRRIKNVLHFYIDSAKELGLMVENFDEILIEGEKKLTFSIEGGLPKINSIN